MTGLKGRIRRILGIHKESEKQNSSDFSFECYQSLQLGNARVAREKSANQYIAEWPINRKGPRYGSGISPSAAREAIRKHRLSWVGSNVNSEYRLWLSRLTGLLRPAIANLDHYK
jgi:uncharacterized protein YfaT (DUF1175 family)